MKIIKITLPKLTVTIYCQQKMMKNGNDFQIFSNKKAMTTLREPMRCFQKF